MKIDQILTKLKESGLTYQYTPATGMSFAKVRIRIKGEWCLAELWSNFNDPELNWHFSSKTTSAKKAELRAKGVIE